MRITFVTPGLTLSGGMLAIVGFANGLVERGHSVTIVSPLAQRDSLIQSVDRRVRTVWTRSRLKPAPGRQLTNAWLALDLARVTPHSDALIATYTPTAIPVLLASALGRGRPIWMYADYREMFVSRPLEWWISRNLPRYFAAVMTNSKATVAELRKFSNVDAIFVGLGLPRWDFLTPEREGACRPAVALYVGDSRPRKGLEDFLRAAEVAQQLVPDLRLQIATKDNPEIACTVPFEHLVRPDDQTMVDLYRRCGVFVSTSWYESLGLPPLEAMACGAPVVVTNQRGAGDYAVDGENCLVVPIQAPQATGQAIARVLTEPDLARRLRMAGYRTAQLYRWEPALDRFEAALQVPSSTTQTQRWRETA